MGAVTVGVEWPGPAADGPRRERRAGRAGGRPVRSPCSAGAGGRDTGVAVDPATAEAAALADEARHFRGSTLLVLGRFVGLGLDFVTQVLIVRALARTDYGAFAFALSVSSLAATVGLLGLDKTISRFVRSTSRPAISAGSRGRSSWPSARSPSSAWRCSSR